jgi:hypothetical protein
MASFNDADDPRRRLLINGLTVGLLATGLPRFALAQQSIFGKPPAKLPPGQSIYRINGKATVNGKEADLDTKIGPNDTVQTDKGSEIVFVAGTNAILLRGDTKLAIQGQKKEDSFIVTSLRVLSGALLSVSRNQAMNIQTPTATIGIRGTGLYVEAEPDLTYFCTCYGITDVTSNSDPTSTDTVVATHHDKPLFITADAPAGKNVKRAGFRNHTDQELMLVETIAGRTTPFVFSGGSYDSPRRSY